MNEYFIATVILLALGIIFYLADQTFLWMERHGLLYYRHTKPSGTTGVGNALHELHSMFETDVKSQEEIREELQQEAQTSGDEIEDENTDWIENGKDINK